MNQQDKIQQRMVKNVKRQGFQQIELNSVTSFFIQKKITKNSIIIFRQINKMTHNNTSNSLLNIDFSVKKGLILNWNFSGSLSNNNFYRHLLILDTDDIGKAQAFLKLYYKKIKSGDLFSVKKTFQNKTSSALKWKQKNLLQFPNFDKVYCDCFNLEELRQVLYETSELIESGQGQQPLILSILTDKTNTQQLNDIISGVRNQRKVFNFIVNFFGAFKNGINFRTGINFFQFNPSNREYVLQFYKNYINRIEFYYVKITIQCENGSICCQKISEWPNTAFNKISKQFYGPHKDYQFDNLFFLNSQNYGQLDLLLNITLEYVTLDSRKFMSSKRISLTSIDSEIQSRTLSMYDSQHETEMYTNVWFDKYPFKTQFFVWFNKDKQNNLQNSLKRQLECF